MSRNDPKFDKNKDPEENENPEPLDIFSDSFEPMLALYSNAVTLPDDLQNDIKEQMLDFSSPRK